MRAASRLRSLHEKNRSELGMEHTPIPAFTADQLEELERACGGPLPKALKEILATEGVFDYAPEVFFEDVGYFALGPPDRMIEDAQNLRSAADDYGWDLPPCCALSLVNNEFIAVALETETVIAINGDDGDVTELGWTLDELYERCAAEWEALA